uniref:50S ribosomal protein L20 n=1 Tax=Apophlaea sinclairii TaxID=212746 RepID=A0A1C9CBE7_9FLOR|nr:ribosomal protein L20 [Apophlaea sinclairii]AOM65711.1 ribosomal protein L20 [Apophlaea sinclairii]
MTRIKRGNTARKRRKKFLKLAKSFKGSHSVLFRTAKQQVLKALKYSYFGRKQKKRNVRKLWIIRINAAARLYSISYNQLICNLKSKNISLNRKMLAYLATADIFTFSKIVSNVTL